MSEEDTGGRLREESECGARPRAPRFPVTPRTRGRLSAYRAYEDGRSRRHGERACRAPRPARDVLEAGPYGVQAGAHAGSGRGHAGPARAAAQRLHGGAPTDASAGAA
ncbi:hypothetical protein GCM10010421_29180 [Streptomyces glaucus]|uniref:Secreted protein n=1 Tax=Streptomyces glaucus TaxID=284029 RepID=A0ABP5WVJ5_9ACTN